MSVSWRIRESNPRPRACWARALPTELIPHWNFRHLPTTSTTDLSYPPTPPKDIAATVKVPLRFATQLLVLNRLPLIPYRSNLTLSKNWHFSLLLRPWIEHGASRSSVLRSPNWAIEARDWRHFEKNVGGASITSSDQLLMDWFSWIIWSWGQEPILQHKKIWYLVCDTQCFIWCYQA